MYILQFCNTFTQEILREEIYKSPEMIASFIHDFTKELPADVEKIENYIVDSQMRILKADYVTYKKYQDGNDTIFKLFFRIQAVEAKIR